ncbi:MAG TPA: NADH:ubiquinone oxidoreductase, partial [Methanolinea sp.]|nr:NADH:ubiquinone oxidoreductase [Methanolinea sp.]
MGGLGHNMKYTMVFFVIGALAIAGIPPFNGFASKLMIYESVFMFNPILSIIAMVVSILTLASFVKVFHSIFMGPKLPEYADVKEAPAPMLIGMGILAVVVVLFGLFPGVVVDHLIEPAAQALVNQGAYISAVMGGA